MRPAEHHRRGQPLASRPAPQRRGPPSSPQCARSWTGAGGRYPHPGGGVDRTGAAPGAERPAPPTVRPARSSRSSRLRCARSTPLRPGGDRPRRTRNVPHHPHPAAGLDRHHGPRGPRRQRHQAVRRRGRRPWPPWTTCPWTWTGAASRPSWVRRAPASRRCCTCSPVSTARRRARCTSATPRSPRSRQAAHDAPARPDRLHLPVLQPAADPHRGGEHRPPHADRRPAAGSRLGRLDRRDRRPRRPARAPAERSCPAASSSGSPRLGPWRRGRRSSSPTSRPARSTRGPAPSCSASSAPRWTSSRPDRRDGHPRPDRGVRTPTASSSSPTATSSTRCTAPSAEDVLDYMKNLGA